MVANSKIRNVEDSNLSIMQDVLGPILNRNVKISIADIADTDSPKFNAEMIGATLGQDLILVEAPIEGALSGTIYLILNQKLAAAITDLMVMGDGTAPFNESESLDGITEAVNQLIGALSTEWADQLDSNVRGSGASSEVVTPSGIQIDMADFIQVEYNISIEEWGDATFIKLSPPDIEDILSETVDEGSLLSDPGIQRSGMGMDSPDPSREQGRSGGSQTRVKPAEFAPFDEGTPILGEEEARNLDLLLDISLPVTIELGRTNMLIRDVLEIGPGSVIELQKLSGEPVDLYVNDKKFALGEVVVIDENFGIRITELLKVEDRIKALR